MNEEAARFLSKTKMKYNIFFFKKIIFKIKNKQPRARENSSELGRKTIFFVFFFSLVRSPNGIRDGRGPGALLFVLGFEFGFFFMCVCVSFVRLIDARIYNPTQEGKGWRAPNLTKRKEKKR